MEWKSTASLNNLIIYSVEELSQTPPKDPKLDISPAYYLSKKPPKKTTVNKAEEFERERQCAIELLNTFAENRKKRIRKFCPVWVVHVSKNLWKYEIQTI